MSDEADLSAEQSGACTPPRLPRADGNGGRSQRPPCTPRTRSQEAFGIISGNSPAPVVRAEVLVRAEVALGTEVSGAVIHGLKIRRDFLAANAGKRAPMPGFVLLARDRADGVADMRIGFTVTKKIGNSVVRNRLKRRLRALARDVLPKAGLPGHDHVLIGRSDGLQRDFAVLQADLAKALAKVARGPAR